MSKYDDILNELVYQIDDVVYEFYSKSNEIIAVKSEQERLLSFRDKTINTINDMNVRSLEIISEFKNEALVKERAEALLAKNKDLVASSLSILQGSPDKNEFLEDVQNLATGVYESAKDVFKKIEDSGVVDRIADKANEGFKKVQEGLEEFSKHPTVQKSADIIKEKTKEAVEAGSKLVKDGTKFVTDKINDAEDKGSEVYHEVVDAGEDVADIFKETPTKLQDVIDKVTENDIEEKDDK
ncbi:hypothetical protein G7062_08485 [Erysipelothrix sp. HDW6C]|uniref:hypothetical protein n=1 Tax=Erysipelothrix sp. HDW6C TaxID=2714930 RepID=UPI00140D8ABA|nr:hypothetical protein [Erysipelothrix sp. HDW6C]QIK70329.1 hypothetical protein G7062_08485 [Erysipelothrix sp. HDW6C]